MRPLLATKQKHSFIKARVSLRSRRGGDHMATLARATGKCRRGIYTSSPSSSYGNINNTTLRRWYSRPAPSSRYAATPSREADHHRSNSTIDPWRSLITTSPPSANVTDEHSITSDRLNGWRVSVKDNFCTSDMPTTCSSKMLAGYQPTFDASVVSRLKEAGAHIVGKSQLDEFAMGSSNVHTHFDIPINPAGKAGEEFRATGGSSGGAAASVSGGVCRVGIGSDTGGSVRLPAAFCGVWGLKPSYGMISRWGLVPYADSLDTVGIIAHDWQDCAATLDVLTGHDRRDPTSASETARKRAKDASRRILKTIQSESTAELPLKGLRIGIPSDMFAAEMNSQVLTAFDGVVRFLASKGATVVPARLPNASLALGAYYVIASAEASSNLARYDGIRYGFRHDQDGADDQTQHDSHKQYSLTRTHGFGSAVRSRILLGTHALSADAFNNTFVRAQKIRKVIQDDFDAAFRIPNVLRDTESYASSSTGVDILLHPCSTNTAPTIKSAIEESSEEEYVQDILTAPSSLAGIPAVSIPSGNAEDGWPVGTMAVSQWGMEDVLGVLGDAMKDFAQPLSAEEAQSKSLLRPDFQKGIYVESLA